MPKTTKPTELEATTTGVSPSSAGTGKPNKVRVKRTKKGIADIRIRYDQSHDKWGVLGDDDRAVRHFDQGYLTGVTFHVIEKPVGFGCGASIDRIGVAQGTFFEGVLPTDSEGFNNIKFYRGFADQNQCPLHTAEVLVLLPGRRAIYK
jgi:hypothetical protein